MSIIGRSVAMLALALALLTSCGDVRAQDNATRDGMCDYYGRMIEANWETQPVKDFIAAGLGYAIRNDAPGLKGEIDSFVSAMDSSDLEGVRSFHEVMSFECEDYWLEHGLPEGLRAKTPEELLDEASASGVP